MAARTLPDNDIAFGRAVLLATDALGMQAEGAFWLHDAEEEKWRFFLITSLFGSLGPREIYSRLNHALVKQLSERETRQFQIYMGGPNESLARAVRAVATTDNYVSEPREMTVSLDREVAMAIVYRMAEPGEDDDVRRAKARFRKLSNALMAA